MSIFAGFRAAVLREFQHCVGDAACHEGYRSCFFRKLAGGGPLMDMGVYSLNACRYLTGEEPVELKGYSSVIDHDGRFDTVEENVSDNLPEEHKICIYRIVQEALNNCSKHACAKNVRIVVRQEPNHLRVSIEDDGKGFDPSRVRGLGLVGMNERVSHLGGVLKVESDPARGTMLKRLSAGRACRLSASSKTVPPCFSLALVASSSEEEIQTPFPSVT